MKYTYLPEHFFKISLCLWFKGWDLMQMWVSFSHWCGTDDILHCKQEWTNKCHQFKQCVRAHSKLGLGPLLFFSIGLHEYILFRGSPSSIAPQLVGQMKIPVMAQIWTWVMSAGPGEIQFWFIWFVLSWGGPDDLKAVVETQFICHRKAFYENGIKEK